MYVPPLATTGSATDTVPGALGEPGTSVIFGDGLINDRVRSGGRFQVGTWLNCWRTVGVEGEYLGLENNSAHFHQWSDGNPVLARPFTNVNPNFLGPDAEAVAFPRGQVDDQGNAIPSQDGSITVDALTRFQAAGARLRFERFRIGYGNDDPCNPDAACGESCRSYFLVGYRFLRLDDSLAIETHSTVNNDPPPIGSNQTIAAVEFDKFSTRNQFHGLELGMEWQWRLRRWSLDFTPKVSLGSVHEIVYVDGAFRATMVDNSVIEAPGGTLALTSNINRYSRNAFAVVPEIGTTLGYQVTPHVRARVGYTFLYMSRVARPGEQIDLQVNDELLPPTARAPEPGDHPAFAWKETGFWAQGLNFGLDFQW